MAKSRCIPTQLFWDSAFCELNSDAQCVFIGLTLEADDHGRGLANVDLLVRSIDKPAEIISPALDRLEELGFISRYQVGRHTYYQHNKWDEWQRLDKRTPSLYPAPPEVLETENSQTPEAQSCNGMTQPEVAGISPDFPGKNPLEEEGEEEENKNTKRNEEEAETQPANITPFPATRSDNGNALGVDQETKKGAVWRGQVAATTREVAAILQLPNNATLQRVVADFLLDPTLSLAGEADMAREYLDDPLRNHRGKTMSPAFYRQWLKREREHAKGAVSSQKETESHRQAIGATRVQPPGSLSSRSLMDLESEYQGHRKHQQKGNQG